MRSDGEFRRGWKTLLTSAVGMGCGMSAVPIYTLGTFTKPLGEAFGWSRGEVQLNYTVMGIANLIVAPALGWLIDNYGARKIILWSLVGMASGYFAFALTGAHLWYFYLIAAYTAVVGFGTLPITWTRAIVAKFEHRRGLALGLALAGSGLSGSIMPSYTGWLVHSFGWRVGYAGLALLPLVLAFPLTYVLMRDDEPRPEASQRREVAEDASARTSAIAILRGAMCTLRFWVILAAFSFIGGSVGAMIAHYVPMLTDRGITPVSAAAIAGVIGITVIAGRLIIGYLLDRFWAPAVAAIVMALPVISFLTIASHTANGVVLTLAAVLVGLAAGAEFDLMAFLVSRYFDIRHYGVIYSLAYSMFRLAAGIGAPVFGWAYDRSHSYSGICYAAAIATGICAAGLLTLGPYRTVPKQHV